MSRYIDADVLKEKIDSMWNGRPLSSLGARILVTIDEAPSIDIVRCAECKHWRNTDAEKIPTASIACGNMHDDDFCSYGEREGE